MSFFKFSLKWVFREWKWSPLLFGLTFFLLFLAYLGVLLNLSYQSSSDLFLKERSRLILGADIVVSSPSELSEADLQELNDKTQGLSESRLIEFMGNIRSKSAASMAEVYAVDSAYPLLGQVQTSTGNGLDWSQPRSLYADRELSLLLGLAPGDEVKIGSQNFVYRGFLTEDSSLIRGSSVVAARVYIERTLAEATGLLQFGSRVDYDYFFALPDPAQTSVWMEKLKPFATEKGWRVRSAEDSLNRIERTLDFVGKYLSWLSLLMILLGFITGFYLSQVQLRSAAQRFALLIQMGLSHRGVQLIYGFKILLEQILALSLAAGVLALILHQWINPAMTRLPIVFQLKITGFSLTVSIGLALVLGLLFFLPYLLRLPKLQLKSLLDQSAPFLPESVSHNSWRSYTLILVFFYALTGLFLKDYRLSLVWLGFLLISLSFPLWVFPRFFTALGRACPWVGLKIPLLQLSRVRFASTLLFISLCQILFVLSLLPQLEGALRQQIEKTSQANIPSFFAINMQEEDLTEIQNFFSENSGRLTHLSPMILGRLTEINNQPTEEERFLTRPLRLSYRGDLLESETVLEGPDRLPVADPQAMEAELSMEEGYAERYDFKLGDKLAFDVGGIEIRGRIAQIRRVQWESFQPNFFIQFQEGVLDDFPKTWIGVVYDIPAEKRLNLLKESLEKFSSMSLIDLSEAIEKLSKITETLIVPVRLAAQGQSLLNFLILFLLIGYHQRSRSREFVLFKLLGASPAKVQGMMLTENLILNLAAGILSLTLALGFSNWLLYEFFETRYLEFSRPLIYFGISLLIVGGVTWLTTVQVQKKKGQEKDLLAQ